MSNFLEGLIGVYPRGTIDYNSIDAVNISTLVEVGTSPKHYLYAKHNRRKATRPMSLGTAAHAAVLEPDRFESDFAIWSSSYSGGELVNGKEKKQGASRPRNGGAWEAFKAENGRKIIITDDEASEALTIAQAVHGDSLANLYTTGPGLAEVTVVAQHPATGITRKGRLDKLLRVDNRLCLVDLKTATDIGRRFCGAAAKLAYHCRLAWYADIVETITGEAPMVVIVAVENHQPYDVVCYELYDEELDIGRKEYGNHLERLAECLATNRWPGIGDGVMQKFTLPKYYYDQDDDISDLGIEFDQKVAE